MCCRAWLAAGFGDDFDLDARVPRQPGHLNGRARRVCAGEVLRVNLIHRAELGHVGEEHGRLDHVAEIEPLRTKQRLDVGDDLLGLLRDAAFNKFPRIARERNLAGKKDEAACGDACE